MIESGEADLVMTFSGRGLAGVRNGAQFTPVWNDWVVSADQLAVPIGIKDPDAAFAAINAYLGKHSQEIMTEKTSYSPVNADAQPKVDELTQQWLTNTAERQKQAYQPNNAYWIENYQTAAEKWQEFLAGS